MYNTHLVRIQGSHVSPPMVDRHRTDSRPLTRIARIWMTMTTGQWLMLPSAVVALTFAVTAYNFQILTLDQSSCFLLGSWSAHLIAILSAKSSDSVSHSTTPVVAITASTRELQGSNIKKFMLCFKGKSKRA